MDMSLLQFDLGFRGSGFRIQWFSDLGFRGFRVHALGFRVSGQSCKRFSYNKPCYAHSTEA